MGWTLEFFSTYVPAPTGEQEVRVIPTCWYVAQWIREHPEHADLLTS